MIEHLVIWSRYFSALSCHLFSTFVLKVLANAVRHEKETKIILIGKEEIKLFFVCWYHDTLCRKCERIDTNSLELVSDYNKVQGKG